MGDVFHIGTTCVDEIVAIYMVAMAILVMGFGLGSGGAK